MNKESSRGEKSVKNASISLIYYIITNILTFIMRMALTRYIGIEYTGLNSLFTNILGVLNIVELGLGVAVGYSLYKPLAEKDHNKINEILCLYKYLYRIIAVIIGIVGLLITAFIDKFVNTTIPIPEIRITFIMYLFATISSYIFTFLNVLPTADQKNYIVVKIQDNGKIIKNILQLISIVVLRNFYFWVLLEIIANIIIYIYTYLKIRKLYGWYEEKKENTLKTLIRKYKEIVKITRDLFFHKIGGLVVYQTDIILISYFGNLADSGIYSNYMLIYALLSGVVEQAFNGIVASIGNLAVEKSEKEVYTVWKEMYIVMVFVTILFGFLFYQLANPFISVCFGAEYTLSNIIVLGIVINTMFRIIKNPIDKFKEAYGIFWDKYAPIVEALINLVTSILLGMKFGILGIVIGTIISNIAITAIWKPYVVFKYAFKEKLIKFYQINLKYIIIGGVGVALSYIIINLIKISVSSAVLNLIILFIIDGIISTAIILLGFMCDKYFRTIFNKYFNIFTSMIIKNKN